MFYLELVNVRILSFNVSIQRKSSKCIAHITQPPQPEVVYFFCAGVLFNKENAKSWPILTNLGYFVANMRTLGVFFTGLNNVAAYQNLQI